MIQLSVSAACSYVRKELDELVSVEEIGMIASPDALDLHRLVERAMEEAVTKIHNSAPAYLLDGVVGKKGEDFSVSAQGGVVTITMLKDTLRMLSVLQEDSNIVVTEFIPEDSPEGRMQLNEYTRGVPDDPRVVMCKIKADNYKPILKYYTGESDEVSVSYVPQPVLEESIVSICPRLEYAVLNEITAMVLDCLNEKDTAATYRTKVAEYLT